MTEPTAETPQQPEENKYAELMLFLTPDEGGNFAVRCQRHNSRYYYPISEFIANVHKDIISPREAEHIFLEIFVSCPEEVENYRTMQLMFNGPYEKPLTCMTIQGLSIVYHHMELQGLILESKRLEFGAVIKDCLEAKSKQHIKLHDDGQLKMHEEEFAEAVTKADPDALNGNPPEYSIARFDPVLYLAETEEMKAALKKKEQECTAKAQTAQEKADQTIAKLQKQLQAKEIELEASKQKSEALEKAINAQQQAEEDERKRKGAAFSLRDVLACLEIDLNSADYAKMNQHISSTMKEKYPDHSMFIKNKQLHFYESDRRLIELLVKIEHGKKYAQKTERTDAVTKAVNQKVKQWELKPMTRQFNLREVVDSLDLLRVYKIELDPPDYVEIRQRVLGVMERGYPEIKFKKTADDLIFNGSERPLIEKVATTELCAMVIRESGNKNGNREAMQVDSAAVAAQ